VKIKSPGGAKENQLDYLSPLRAFGSLLDFSPMTHVMGYIPLALQGSGLGPFLHDLLFGLSPFDVGEAEAAGGQ